MSMFHCIATSDALAIMFANSGLQVANNIPFQVDNGKMCFSFQWEDVPPEIWPLLIYCCENDNGVLTVRQKLQPGFTGWNTWVDYPPPQ